VSTVLKNDKYRRTRGGHARILDICCANCCTHLFYYQKDGAGHLKRMYLDRIVGQKLQQKNLSCPKCKELIGVATVYKKENRPAIRLFVDSVTKKQYRLVA